MTALPPEEPATTESPDVVEGVDGTITTYSERLRPSVWAWLLVVLAALFLGVAYFAALGPLAGGLTVLVLLGLGTWLLLRTSAVVRVDDQVLRAGRARLPLRYVGRVSALDAERTAIARGPGADARAHMLLRTGYSNRAVAVEVADPRDPHPYWLISTRHPDELRSAIIEARAAALDRSN